MSLHQATVAVTAHDSQDNGFLPSCGVQREYSP
jgi:hypothetical protein